MPGVVLHLAFYYINKLFKMRTYKLRGENVIVSIKKYGNNRPCIIITDEDGLPYMIATINAPERPLEDNEVIIKDYAENEGVYKWLLERNIISSMIGRHQVGFELAPICVLHSVEEWGNENAPMSEIDDYLD